MFHVDKVKLITRANILNDTLRAMNDLILKYRKDPTIRGLAVSAATAGNGRLSREDQAKNIYNFCQGVTFVTGDIKNIETVQNPVFTLQAGGGDCDDLSVLVCTMFQAVGFDTRFVLSKIYSITDYDHVYCEVEIPSDEGGKWIPCDLSEPGNPFGNERHGRDKKIVYFQE